MLKAIRGKLNRTDEGSLFQFANSSDNRLYVVVSQEHSEVVIRPVAFVNPNQGCTNYLWHAERQEVTNGNPYALVDVICFAVNL